MFHFLFGSVPVPVHMRLGVLEASPGSLHGRDVFYFWFQGVVCFSAKLKILEHRQQRISEIRTKYEWLKKELEQTKQHLMLEPEQWSAECETLYS